jgi:sugar phosphate permease
MRGDLGFSMVEIGYISSSFSIAYGFSKFFGGIVSDLMSCRLLFSLGLILAGCSNILFGASSSLASLISLWFTNGTVQGLGWPSLAKIVMINLPKETIGSVWSLLTTAGNLGYMLSPFVFLQLIHIASWRATFVCSGLTAVVCGVAAYLALPQSKSVSPRPETTNGTL